MKIIEEIDTKFGVRPNHCLVNYMMNGSDHYLPMHQDQPFSKGAKKVEHKDSVYIITVGASRPLVFGGKADLGKKEKNELTGFITSVCCEQGDLFELRGNLNTEVTHGILKDATVKDVRVSLTFRFVEHSYINVASGALVDPESLPSPQQQQLQEVAPISQVVFVLVVVVLEPVVYISPSKVEKAVPDIKPETKEQVKPDATGKSWKRLIGCAETFTDSQTPQAIDIQTQPAPAKNGLRNRRFGLLEGKVTAEYMRDYIIKHGWVCYVVCQTIEGPFCFVFVCVVVFLFGVPPRKHSVHFGDRVEEN